MRIDNETKFVGLFTRNPTNLGSAMHNAAYEYLGLNFVYLPFLVENLEGAVAGARALNFRGASVSIPFKQNVIKYLDNIDPVSERIGAVNTVINDKGVLTGYNTDCAGAVEALLEVTELSGRRAFLIGAGGAARAIAYSLKENGSSVFVFNRSPEKARETADRLGLSFGGSLEEIVKKGGYDILINATPVGSAPKIGESVINEAALQEGKIVMDIVSTPIETTLLRYAESKGCKVVHGYRMLLHQAAAQFELFTGQKAPFEVMERAVLEALR